ncbi:MAG: hypothetical protein ABW076_11965 [Candidatus Thiodiazotropha sp.]
MQMTKIALALTLSLPALSAFADTTQTQLEQQQQQIQELRKRLQAIEEGTVDEKPREASDNRFNPAISLVLQGGLVDYSEDPEEFHLQGMPLGGEAGLHEQGLALWETELTAAANVDNLFYAQTTLGMHTHDGDIELDIEEAYLDTLGLPAGVGVRFGRFYSAIGYLNDHHTHTWDFADAPLAYQAFLGKQYRDDGLRLSWVAPVDSLLLEIGGEMLRGSHYPGGEHEKALGASRTLFVNLGGDLGQSHSWQLGLSYLGVDSVQRSSGGHSHEDETETHTPLFDGDSDLAVIDGVWKTELGGERALIVQGEYLLRDESGQISLEEEGGTALIDYQGDQSGWYLQGIYQFNRQWRTGLRYDRLNADNDLSLLSNGTDEEDDHLLEASGYFSGADDPHRSTLMVDWSPSEFSRLRLQYALDDSRADTDRQLALQYIMTLGAHAAHAY